MSKSFVFLLFIISGVLMAQAVRRASPETKEKSAPKSTQRKISTPGIKQEQTNQPDSKLKNEEEKTNDDEKEGEELKSPRPFLSCVLFEDDSACNVTCSLLGSIYSNPSITSGSCQKNNQCECEVSPETTLDELWKAKFNSDEILKTIRDNQNLSKKVLEVLQRPFETPRQTLQNIKPLLTKEQQEKLHVKENRVHKSLLTTKKGKFDAMAIQKYVAKKKSQYRKTLQQGITYYEDILTRAFFKPDFDERNCIFCEIRRSQNKLLIDHLDNFVKRFSLIEYPDNCSDQESFQKVLDIALINQVITPPLRKTKPMLPSTNPENPAWVLEGFDNSQVARHTKGKKCWRNANYHICVNKTKTSTILEWTNENPKTWITMNIHSDGRIFQHWIHNYNSVEINQNSDGESKQHWSFGESGLKITKYPGGKTIRKPWFGEEDLEAFKKYKQFIDSWCQQNGDLVGRDNCIIY